MAQYEDCQTLNAVTLICACVSLQQRHALLQPYADSEARGYFQQLGIAVDLVACAKPEQVNFEWPCMFADSNFTLQLLHVHRSQSVHHVLHQALDWCNSDIATAVSIHSACISFQHMVCLQGAQTLLPCISDLDIDACKALLPFLYKRP